VSQPWHYRGYSRKNPGKKTTIFQSRGQNGPTPSAKHWVIWQIGREESQRKTQEALAGWCYWRLLSSRLEHREGYTPSHWQTTLEDIHTAVTACPASPWQQEEEEEEICAWINPRKSWLLPKISWYFYL